jgi:hypothetical protein
MLDELINELNSVTAEKEKFAKREKDIKAAIITMYEKDFAELLSVKEEPFGVVNVVDGKFKLSATYPKKVTWDQTKLADLYEQIKKGNENPLDYMKVEYDVPETKYKAWPEVIKSEFVTARTVERGNPTLKWEVVDA